ncbi:DUF72 domain-containing protein [candidate division KSB1 bacterium]|nr:DUF72 domain-containing protein [candidate division KSB1 bacterium]
MNPEIKKYIKLGSSSWAFEGWQGLVYFQDYPKGRFKLDCLAEYARDPRFSTVGMDLFFYQPPSKDLLDHYGNLLPEDFKTCSKVWEGITIYRYPNHSRYGSNKGKVNPSYLNPEVFNETVLTPYRESFTDHTGPFIFEFQYMRMNDKSIEEFCEDLDQFFSKLPPDFQYSVEIRNKNFLDPIYFETLRKHNVAHVFNQWTFMPLVSKQLSYDSITADFIVSRILTPPGLTYQETVTMFEPFDKIKTELPQMRSDVMDLIRIAVKETKYAYILINNRVEGSAPLTIKALWEMVEKEFK